MSFLSNKFKLEVKTLESQVAKFITNNEEVSISIVPNYHNNSNTEYAMIGARNGNEAFFAIGSNGYTNTVVSFDNCNINFYKDTVIRGNFVVDGFVMTTSLDVVVSKDDLPSLSNMNLGDTGSNTIVNKYYKWIDERNIGTSNIIIKSIEDARSNLYDIGIQIMSSNPSTTSFFSENSYDSEKFDIRLASKTADDINDGIINRYIVNDTYSNNKLIIDGIQLSSNLQGNNIYIEGVLNANKYYGDGSKLYNILPGDGTTDSIIEGSNLFFKPEYVENIVYSCNLELSNYVYSEYTYIDEKQGNLFNLQSNILYDINESICDMYSIYITDLSNYILTDISNLNNNVSNNKIELDIYIHTNEERSSNYLDNISNIYPLINDASNMMMENIIIDVNNISNYALETSNILYASLMSTSNEMINKINEESNLIGNIIDYKYIELSNLSLNENGYSNMFDRIIKISYDTELNDYIQLSSNYIIIDTDVIIEDNSNYIYNVYDINSNIINELCDILSSNIRNVSNEIHYRIVNESLKTSNMIEDVNRNMRIFLTDVINEITGDINQTSNYIENVGEKLLYDVDIVNINVSNYDKLTSNEIVMKLENRIGALLGNAYTILNNTNSDIDDKINILSTNTVREGVSNYYYTENKFNEFFETLTFDNFRQGVVNKCIVNNIYNGNLNISGTIASSNMIIYGEQSVINTAIYQTGSAVISSSNNVNLVLMDNHHNQNILQDIIGLYDKNGNIVMAVKTDGKVCIKRDVAYDMNIAVDISGTVRGGILSGSGVNIENVNLSDLDTDDLSEGSNLYFKYERVGNIIDASNMYISNYIKLTSNENINNINIIDKDQSNYVVSQSNIIFSFMENSVINNLNYTTRTSNEITLDIERVSFNLSNYVLNSSKELLVYSSNIIDIGRNYVGTTYNSLYNTLNNNLINQSNYVIATSNNILNQNNIYDINASNYVIRTSNIISTVINLTNLPLNQSNFMIRTSNLLYDNINNINYNFSNYIKTVTTKIVNDANASNLSIPNYIKTTSNQIITYASNMLTTFSAVANTYSIQTNGVTTTNKIKTNKWQEEAGYDSMDNKYIYYQEGNVGIGNTIPSTATLDILSGVGINSLKTTNPIWTNLGVITSSDERIKKNIRDINDDTALNLILQIEPKSYNYIENNRSQNNVYGFIAQQIREVIPDAVTLHTEAVPNIYTLCNITSNVISMNANIEVKKDEKIMLVDVNGKKYVESVEYVYIENDKLHIVIYNESKISDGTIFVYGKVVNDFHVIDKSYIYTLNVCALQEIYRRYVEIREDLSIFDEYENYLPQKIIDISSKANELDAYIKSYVEMIDSLEGQNILDDDVKMLRDNNKILVENIETYNNDVLKNAVNELNILQVTNDLLTSNNKELLKEYNNITDTIRNYTNEIITIQSILQMNNIS
jgi:hypothetical protein